MRRVIVWVTLTFGLLSALQATDKNTFDFIKYGGRSPMKSTLGVTWSKHYQAGFNLKVWLSNQMAMGIEAWDPFAVPPNTCATPGIGMEYPAGSCIEHLFGAGPCIGGFVNGVRHVTAAYNGDNARMEFLPEKQDTARDRIWLTHSGPEEFHTNSDGNTNGYNGYYWRHGIQVNRRGCDDDGDGRVDEDDLDGQDNDGDWNPLTDDIGADGLPDSLEVSCDGTPYDPVTNPDPAYDNYDPANFDKCHTDANGNYIRKRDKDHYTQNNGIPDHGEPHVDEDYAALSDQDVYFGATDTFRSFTVSGLTPLHVKLFQKNYSWRGSFADGIMPIDYSFVNIGKNNIDNVYIGMFADFDVGPVTVSGYPAHDFACYMDDLRCAYIHNAEDRGSTPAGIVVLGTPKPLDSLQYVWQWTGFNVPGTNDSLIYALMDGSAEPGALIKPCQSPSSPTDTRFWFAFGPFNTMKPGDTLKITIALVSGQGVDAGPSNLRENAQNALKLYLRGFRPPISIPSPPLKITNLITKPYGVKIEWGSHLNPSIDPQNVWDDSNKLAQAYPPNSWRRINPPCAQSVGCTGGHLCTYDDSGHPHLSGGRIFEGYRLYRNEDPGTAKDADWTLVRQYDMGDTPFEYNTKMDSVFYDTNLVRGKRYWYSVTSFGLPDIAVIPTKDASGNTHYDTLYAENVESPLSENSQAIDVPFSISDKLQQVLVVPNPYRVDKDYTYENGGWEGQVASWDETKRLVKFIHLPSVCTIRVFSLSGDLVTTLYHNDPSRGEMSWNLLSQSGRALASGIYIYSVESSFGRQIGKFVLIR